MPTKTSNQSRLGELAGGDCQLTGQIISLIALAGLTVGGVVGLYIVTRT